MKPNYLENIPQNWQIKKLKYLFKNVIGGVWGNEAQNDENDFICIRVADFNYEKGEVKKNKKFTLRNIKDSEQKNRILEKGDLLLEKSGGGEKTPVGRIVIFDLDKPAVCSNFINLLKVQKEYESTFLNYYFAFLYEKGVSKKYINQTTGIQNLNTSAFFDEKIILPPLSEQQKIANFLDKKTTELDTLIKKKKKLIKLLQEDEKAFINEKITKGINEVCPMKDSGIEWIGKIPKHWKISRMKNICKVRQGLQIPIDKRFLFKEDDSLEYITIRSINKPKQAKEYIKNPPQNVICTEEDILMARTGATGEAIINVTGVFHNNFFLIDYNRLIVDKMFLYYFLKSSLIKEHLLMVAGVTTIPDLNHQDFYNTPFFQFSLEEQKKIVSEIENYTHKNRNTIEKLSKEVDLLKEYRQSLISEAVTGQLVI